MAIQKALRLTAEQCAQAMREGDLGADIRGGAELVVVVLTQSWCPQWKMMTLWLDAAAEAAGARVYYVEYDQEPFFEPFMRWKEDTFGNRSVPYLRYYRVGSLVAESNFLSRDGFLARLAKRA